VLFKLHKSETNLHARLLWIAIRLDTALPQQRTRATSLMFVSGVLRFLAEAGAVAWFLAAH
jgi:hypothetical protein